jgi:flagellar biosynthesis GTPase FlhF
VLRERPLPVSFITAGQRVPEDLDRATPALLASAMLREFPLSHEANS